MGEVSMIGLDNAKSVFQVRGFDDAERAPSTRDPKWTCLLPDTPCPRLSLRARLDHLS